MVRLDILCFTGGGLGRDIHTFTLIVSHLVLLNTRLLLLYALYIVIFLLLALL